MRAALLSTVCALAVGEAALRVLDLPRLRYAGYGMAMTLDPVALYRATPRTGDTNDLGYRGPEVGPKTRRRVLVVGDSFVHGVAVGPPQNLPSRLAVELPEVEVVPAGVVGYGPDQELARLLSDGLLETADVVVLVLFPSNDFRDIERNGLVDVDARGRLVWRHPNAIKALPQMRLLQMFRMVARGRYFATGIEDRLWRAYWSDAAERTPSDAGTLAHRARLMRAVLAGVQEAVASRRLLVALVPDFQAMERGDCRMLTPDLEAERVCEELGLEVLALWRYLPSGSYGDVDRHLSVSGNVAAAREIARWLS